MLGYKKNFCGKKLFIAGIELAKAACRKYNIECVVWRICYLFNKKHQDSGF